MRKSKFNAKDHIVALNTVKKDTQDSKLSKEFLLRVLGDCGLPTYSNFWTVFRNSGLIKRVGKSTYVWAFKEPIHYNRLQNVYNDYLSKMRDYKKLEGKASEPSSKETEDKMSDIENKPEVQLAIRLLKGFGFKILKPVTSVYTEV